MARSRNWQKAKEQTLVREAIAADKQAAGARQDKYFKYKSDVNLQKQLLEQGIWPTGKHQGKKLSNLAEGYLVWAGLNHKSKHLKYAANNELLRRYNAGQIKL